MKELFEESWCCLQCGQCRWFKSNAEQPTVESTCKRIDHKKFRFAMPWFKSYDCGRSHGIVCRDFEPASWCKWLKEHWVSYDDYYQGDKPSFPLIGFTLGNDTTVRYMVKSEDFINNTFIDSDGNLKWVRKMYYKKSRKSPTGYELVTEYRDEQRAENSLDLL